MINVMPDLFRHLQAMVHHYFVYIMSNKYHTVFYTGITNDLVYRVYQHKIKQIKGFTSKYNCNQLMWYEEHQHIMGAIEREKTIKKWRREWKKNLITEINPDWKDLAAEWYEETP